MRKMCIIVMVLAMLSVDVGEITSTTLDHRFNEVATPSMTPSNKRERPRPSREHLVNDEGKRKYRITLITAPVKKQ
jgi:hypothetical protein